MDELSDEEYRALAEFRYRIRRFLHFSEQAARAAGIEPQQHQLLLAVKAAGAGGGEDGPRGGGAAEAGVTVGCVAERLQLQPHSALELVDRLVARGLLRRWRGVRDRRRVLLGLTPAGEDVLRRLSPPHRRELRAAGPALVRALQALTPPGAAAGAGEPTGPDEGRERSGDG